MPSKIVNIILRHITTFIVIIGTLWVVAKPHAEEFIHDTVNDRISKIEYKLDHAVRQLTTINYKLDRLDR